MRKGNDEAPNKYRRAGAHPTDEWQENGGGGWRVNDKMCPSGARQVNSNLIVNFTAHQR